MSAEPILLFLHGVGKGDRSGKWKDQLERTLGDLGYPSLSTRRVIAPQYAHLLTGWDDSIPLPELTTRALPRDDARVNRRAFERRDSAVERRLADHDHGSGGAMNEAVVHAAMRFPQFDQATNYLRTKEIRANVLTKILAALPESGDVVIIGHSLGSVIAADLLPRLPSGTRCVGMVTIGSPLANSRFDVDLLRDTLKEPPTNLDWWVNCWNPLDPVAANRGLSSVFPWLLDVRVTSTPDVHVHDAVTYLKDPTVASAVGYGLFGSLSKEVERAHSGVELQLDAVERMTLTALRYALLTGSLLEKDVRTRYAGALQQVQATVIPGLIERKATAGQPISGAVTRLLFDPADPESVAPEPLPVGHASKEDAAVVFTLLASENVIRPFEIEVPKDKREAALSDLGAEMGLGSKFGRDVFSAAEEAHKELTGSRINWVKWSLLGVGALAVVAATGGLALAAAPGVAGAAVVTSALAAFGPGGMVGGLITAGTLVTAGGGSIALGLASAQTSAEVLEAVVERQLAVAILRKKQNLDIDPAIWLNFAETEAHLRREHERVDEFSDEKAASVKELKRKLLILERALAYMKRHDMDYAPAPYTH